jgi:uncharacterized protein YjdB
MSGSTLDVPYSVGGVNAGDANAISVLILDGVYDTKAGNDNTANILYYGRLAVDGTFSKKGTGSFSLPSALKLNAWGTDYRVYIIPEQINDSTHTDYAGEPVEIKKSDLNIVDITGITLDKDAADLAEGEDVVLTATITPDNASDKSVIWSSDTPAVATVDETGKVTAKKAGTAKITATATNGTADTTDDLKAVCTVTVIEAKVDITDIALDKTASIVEGNTLTLTATVSPDGATDKTVTWTSDTPAVATVDETGKVTAIKVGTAKITATATN